MARLFKAHGTVQQVLYRKRQEFETWELRMFVHSSLGRVPCNITYCNNNGKPEGLPPNDRRVF